MLEKSFLAEFSRYYKNLPNLEWLLFKPRFYWCGKYDFSLPVGFRIPRAMRGFLQKLQRSPIEVSFSEAEEKCAQDSEGIFLDALNLIGRVASGRKSALLEADIADVTQEVVLRLWKWRRKFSDKSELMTSEDWDSFTARTAHNEINRYCSKRIRKSEVPFDEAHLTQAAGIEGEADAEMVSLVRNGWQGICKLSLYQRQALLFSSVDLVLYLFQFGIEEDELIAELGLTRQSWESISVRMPLTDTEIAEIVNPNSGKRHNGTTAGAVKKARFDARKRLKELMK